MSSNLFKTCSIVLKCVQTCLKLVQMCSNVFKCVQKCSNMFRLAQNLFKCYQRCSNVFKLVQNLFKCGQMFSNVFKLVPPGTLQAYPLTSWNPDQLADLSSPFWSCFQSKEVLLISLSGAICYLSGSFLLTYPISPSQYLDWVIRQKPHKTLFFISRGKTFDHVQLG